MAALAATQLDALAHPARSNLEAARSGAPDKLVATRSDASERQDQSPQVGSRLGGLDKQECRSDALEPRVRSHLEGLQSGGRDHRPELWDVLDALETAKYQGADRREQSGAQANRERQIRGQPDRHLRPRAV
jgi:hypothetical protein